MKIFQSQASMKEYLTVITILVVFIGADFYMFSQNMLTLDQYRLSIYTLVTLTMVYIIVLVIRNQNIMKLRRSRHTRSYEGERLDSFVFQLRDEGKSIEEISIVSGLSIDEVKKRLDTQKEEPLM